MYLDRIRIIFVRVFVWIVDCGIVIVKELEMKKIKGSKYDNFSYCGRWFGILFYFCVFCGVGVEELIN